MESKCQLARILIVDDQPANVLLLEKMLAGNGYKNIRSTQDSREVLDIYREFKPDLVLLDIRMPHLDGFQVIEQLKSIDPVNYTPVIVLTAQSDRETRLKALEVGAKDFVGKPFDRNEVLTRIRNLLEIRVLHREVMENNRILEAKVRERTDELWSTQLEIVRRLGIAAEYRDNETGSHINRISNLVYLLAKSAGCDPTTCELMMHASPMHDVGKIGIPDSVLLKPGKLEPAEWEIMRTHVLLGAQILGGHPSPILHCAHEIALTHHERWDGSGYCLGLKEDAIPLAGRIVAVCDVFDALLSERPYKKPWTLSQTIEELKRGKERHFDPRLIDKFMLILPKVVSEYYPNLQDELKTLSIS